MAFTYSAVLVTPPGHDIYSRNPYQYLNFEEFLDGWMRAPMMRHLSFGYRPLSIIGIINSLPPRLFVGVKRILSSVHEMAEESTVISEKCSEMAGWKVQNNVVSFENDLSPGAWEEETKLGLIKIELDTFTQRRKNVTINSRTARLWGMRKAELLCKIYRCEVPLPFSELDWLRSFVIDVETSFQDTTSQYLRMIIGFGSEARGILVCQTTVKDFNPVCRISQVPRRTHHPLRTLSSSHSPHYPMFFDILLWDAEAANCTTGQTRLPSREPARVR
jgi:hypothetical protein